MDITVEQQIPQATAIYINKPDNLSSAFFLS